MKFFSIAVLYLVLLAACNRPSPSINKEKELVDIFNKMQKQRWKNYDSLGIYADSLFRRTAKSQGDVAAMGRYGMANYSQKKGNFTQAMAHLRSADSILAIKGSDSLKAKVQNLFGVIERHKGNYDISLTHFLGALRLYEKINFKEGIGGLNNNIAQLYQQKENYPAALKHAAIAMNLFKNEPGHLVYLLAAQNTASTYLLLQKPDSALVLDSIGISICTQQNNKVVLSSFLNNKARSFALKKMNDSAREYYRQSFEIDSVQGNRPFMADTYLQLGNMALAEKMNHKAIQFAQLSLDIGHQTEHKKTLQLGWELLNDAYRQKGNYLLALQASDSARYWKDISINQKTENRLAELNTQYESDKKTDQINLQQSKLSRQRIIIIAIITIGILLLALGLLMWRKAVLKKQQQLQQIAFEEQKHIAAAVIKAEERERGRIAADLHDGVGQILTAAWLNLEAVNNEARQLLPAQKEMLIKTMALVNEGCTELRQVSHELMPASLQKKGLVPALQDYLKKIKSHQLSIELHTHPPQPTLNNDQTLMLYRVMQECIHNTTRHAQASRLDISISQDEAGLDILMEDDGRGFEVNRLMPAAGIGMQNILSRIHYINGTVAWDSAPGKGTLVIIHLPSLQHG